MFTYDLVGLKKVFKFRKDMKYYKRKIAQITTAALEAYHNR